MKHVLVMAGMMAFFSATTLAHAGGLFGDGGLIRGSVGRALDKHVEKPVLTPLAQSTVVASGTVAATAVGATVGAPSVGAIVGAGVGDAVNKEAAGE